MVHSKFLWKKKNMYLSTDDYFAQDILRMFNAINLLCCIVLYCIVLYCIVLYCIVLYCIVLRVNSYLYVIVYYPQRFDSDVNDCYPRRKSGDIVIPPVRPAGRLSVRPTDRPAARPYVRPSVMSPHCS